MTAATVSARLHELADLSGDEPFVVDNDSTHSYADVEALVGATAGALAGLGVGPGSAVHIQLRNSLEFVVCLFAVNRLGAIAIPTSAAATTDDVAYVASHSDCSVSLVDEGRVAIVQAAQDMAPEIHHIVTVGAGVAVDGAVALSEIRASADASSAPWHPGADRDLAAVLYTSGTTAWPKGVMLTNRNLTFSGEAVASLLRVRPDDRWLVTLPLCHLNALGYSLMSAVATGASIALPPTLDAADWPAAVARFGATLSSMFAVHARRVLATPPADVETGVGPGLRLFVFAQHLTGTDRAEIEARFGAPTVQVYGLTETVAPTIADTPYRPVRADALGHTSLWTTVKLIDHAGRTVARGGEGELVVRGEPGHTLMTGYFKRPEETALVLRDGWLRTGDRMVQDPDGRFQFLGRAAELIKPGVDNVSAPEIERVLLEHVSVMEASVVGTFTAAGDEEIVACVVLRPGDDATPDELLAWAGERLADYKVPQRVVLLDELPRNPVGKVLRRELQQMVGP